MFLLAMIFSLAACGGEENPPAGNEGNGNPPIREENDIPPSSEENDNETPAHTHSFGEWEITVNPTCTENGTKVRYCSCGEKQSESVPAIGDHTYGEWIVIKTANCGQDGEMARYCSCGAKQTEVIEGEGMHGETIDPAVDPTCTTTGLTEGKHCPYCNTVFVKQEVVPTLEHTYNTTYSFDNSFHWYACSVCGAKKDSAEHQIAENNACSICEHPLGPSVGIIYDKSADGTYAEVIGFEGTATKIRIADTYEGLTVKTIYSQAFYQNGTITSVIIPDSVTSIGSMAFGFCYNLTSVVIGNSVTSIGSFAFMRCNNLTSLVIGDSVTSIGSDAFSKCSKLQFNEYENCKYLGSKDNPYFALIEVTTQNLSSYTIHEDTKVIADRAFENCSRLTSIEIPDSVTSIGNSAFSSCSRLTDVYFTGIEEEWKEITIISSGNSYLINATKHYNYVPEE